MSTDLQRERAAVIWPILARVAGERKSITYQDLAQELGLHHRVLARSLEVIQRYCAESGLPSLTSLVVNKQTGLPGAGSNVNPEALPREREKVFAHFWGPLPSELLVDKIPQDIVPPAGVGRQRNLHLLTSATAVHQAIAEFESVGRHQFLAKYGFAKSRGYFLKFEDKLYDSKPIAAAAYGYQHGVPLQPQEFSGGEKTVATRFRRLGFRMETSKPPEVTRESVERALQEARNLGTSRFLEQYGQNESVKFDLIWSRGKFPAKAVMTVAEHLITGLPVRDPGDWDGTEITVARPLRALGFDVVARSDHHGGHGPHRDPSIPPGQVAPDGNDAPERRTSEADSVVRDPAVARWVRRLYQDTCQFCGVVLRIRQGTTATAAHIRALGTPHNGPDTPGNVLCLCPNCHTLFDGGALYVLSDGQTFGNSLTGETAQFQIHADHLLDLQCVAYHRETVAEVHKD